MPRAILRPASAGITAVTGIAAPASGLQIVVTGYRISATLAANVFISSNATPADANLIDSFTLAAGGFAENLVYPLKVPVDTALFVVASAGALYGYIDFYTQKASG